MLKVELHSINNNCYAKAIYNDGNITIKPNSQINMNAASYAKGKLVKKYRNDREYVCERGNVIKECTFPSPSAAARFVTGRSVNGYDIWKTVEGLSLGNILIEMGIRQPAKRSIKGGV